MRAESAEGESGNTLTEWSVGEKRAMPGNSSSSSVSLTYLTLSTTSISVRAHEKEGRRSEAKEGGGEKKATKEASGRRTVRRLNRSLRKLLVILLLDRQSGTETRSRSSPTTLVAFPDLAFANVRFEGIGLRSEELGRFDVEESGLVRAQGGEG